MKKTKQNISVLILLFINFVFAYKYALRATDFALLLSIVLLLVQAAFYFYQKRAKISNQIINAGFLLAGTMWLLLVTYSHYKIPLESLQVDRWSVISSFFDELLKGNYPYFARSHRGCYPGPMPFYFVLASPFYFFGELALFSFIGYAVISILFAKTERKNNGAFIAFYLITSVFSLWEITVRSNVFTNASLILLLVYVLDDFDFRYSLKFVILAILTGLMLSTRSVFSLVYCIFFISFLTNKTVPFKKLALFLSISILSFAMTFLPFIAFFYADFLKMNPFIVQSSILIPTEYTLLFIVISIGLSFAVKQKADRFFYSGFSLFISILIYALYHICTFGLQKAYIESVIDVSYFILSVPFLLYYISLDPQEKPISKTF
jgi:hypothetical protein